MAKIAVVSTYVMFPTHSGPSAKVRHLAQALTDLGHDVHFVHVAGWSAPPSWPLHIEKLGREKSHLLISDSVLDRFHFKVRGIAAKIYRRGLRAIRSPLQNYFLLDEEIMPGLGVRLRALNDREHFDCVIVVYVFLAKLLDWLPSNTLKVIDALDPCADRHKKMVSNQDRYRWYSISPKVERAGLRRADVVLAIEDNEAMHFRKELGDGPQVHTVGHFVEIFDVIQQTDEPHVAYLGAMSMGNADTLRFFLREIMPRVLKTIPDFKLFVAGSVCGVLENEVNVIALGEVSDVREVFNKAPILVSPTRIGTGIAIKLLSALGHGVPVVTTEVGARGHDDKGGMVVVADNDPYAFADALVALVGDQPRRQKLGLGAAEHAAKWNAAQRLALAKAITAPVF